MYSWQKYDEVLSAEEALEKRSPVARDLAEYFFYDDCVIDWWSKYYDSVGEIEKAPGFAECALIH